MALLEKSFICSMNFGPVYFRCALPPAAGNDAYESGFALNIFRTTLLGYHYRKEATSTGVDSHVMFESRRYFDIFGVSFRLDKPAFGMSINLLVNIIWGLLSFYLLPAFPFFLQGVILARHAGLYSFCAAIAGFSVITESLNAFASQLFIKKYHGQKVVYSQSAYYVMPLIYLMCAGLVIGSIFTTQASALMIAAFLLLSLSKIILTHSHLLCFVSRLFSIHLLSYNHDEFREGVQFELVGIRAPREPSRFSVDIQRALSLLDSDQMLPCDFKTSSVKIRA